MVLELAKAQVHRAAHLIARRGLPRMRSIADMRQRHSAFEEIVTQVRATGTSSLSHFRNDYTHEGGLRLQQNPSEFASLVLLLQERRPIGEYIEIGSASGGTGRYLADAVSFATFTSIDDGRHPDAPHQTDNFAKIEGFGQFLGDSHSEAARDYLTQRFPLHDIEVAFIDGDHSWEGVSQDINLVRPFCRSGAWLVFHDTVACEGVERAWISSIRKGVISPVAEFIGNEVPLGIGVGCVL